MNKKLIKFNLKENRYLLAIFTFLLIMVGTVFPLISRYKDYGSDAHLIDNIAREYIWGINVILVLTIAFTIIAPLVLFSYLSKRSSIDVYHSLPISKKSLFITNFETSYLLAVLPFLVSIFLQTLVYSILTGKILFTASWFISILFIIIMLVAILIPITFICINTTYLGHSIIYIFIILLTPIIALSAIDTFGITYITGFNYGALSYIGNYISPFIAIFTFTPEFNFSFLQHSELYSFNAYNPLIIITWWILFSILGIYGLIQYSKNMQTENIHNQKFSRYFHGAIIYITSFIFFLFILTNLNPYNFGGTSSLTVSDFILPTIYTYIFFNVLQSVRYRNFRTFFKHTKKFIYFVIITCLIIISAYLTNLFGYTVQVPDSSLIDYSSVVFDSISVDINNPQFISNEIIFKEKEDNEKIATLTQKVVKEQKNSLNILSSNTYSSKVQIFFELDVQSKYGVANRRIDFGLSKDTFLELASIYQKSPSFIENNAIFEGKTKITNFTIYNKDFSKVSTTPIDLDKLKEIYLEELSTVGVDAYYFDSTSLEYLISYRQYDIYGSKIPSYLSIDSRFPKSIQYIESLTMDWSGSEVNLWVGDPLYTINTQYIYPQDYENYVDVSDWEEYSGQTLSGPFISEDFATSNIYENTPSVKVVKDQRLLFEIPLKP